MTQEHTTGTVAVEAIDDTPAGGTVCHYDELGEAARNRWHVLVSAGGDATSLDPSVSRALGACDYVKYTDYYRVTYS